MSSPRRVTSTSRTVVAGCRVCHGFGEAKWHGPNAQAIAARHHDATGHNTWADVALEVRYGTAGGAPAEQLTLTG